MNEAAGQDEPLLRWRADKGLQVFLSPPSTPAIFALDVPSFYSSSSWRGALWAALLAGLGLALSFVLAPTAGRWISTSLAGGVLILLTLATARLEAGLFELGERLGTLLGGSADTFVQTLIPEFSVPLLLLLTGGIGLLLLKAHSPLVALLEDLRTQPSVYGYVTPAIVSTFLLVFIPFLAGIGLAFFYAGPGDPANYDFAGLAHFANLLAWETGSAAGTFQFTDSSGDVLFRFPRFYFTLFVTILWTVLNVFLHLFIGLGLALLLNKPGLRFKKLYRVLLILPWAIPSYITALTWKMMFHTEFGSINHALATVGISPIDWLGSGDGVGFFVSNFTANLATNTWLGFPFMMVVSLGALQSIPSELYEAASIDGATRKQQFKMITLPLLKPALLPAVLLGSIWTFNMFNVVYLVSGGAPFDKTNILITEAFRYFNADKDYGMAAAYSVIIFVILLGYSAVTNKVTKATEGAIS